MKSHINFITTVCVFVGWEELASAATGLGRVEKSDSWGVHVVSGLRAACLCRVCARGC